MHLVNTKNQECFQMKSMKRNRFFLYYYLILICIILILTTGCFSYGEPNIEMNAVTELVSADKTEQIITYDSIITITNTGTNNAYDLSLLTLLSTPPDQPEYRMTTGNIDIGTLKKGETTTKKITLPLQVTNLHYQKMASGEELPNIETKVLRVSSNIMG